MGPIIGRAAAAAAAALAKKAAKNASKKTAKELEEESAKTIKKLSDQAELSKATGTGARGDTLAPRYESAPRTGQGYRDRETTSPRLSDEWGPDYKKGGSVKSSASRRADGIAQRGKTKGRML
jgi:hypothetical protein